MEAVTDATFEIEVLDSPGPVVVDFWAPWCGPCRAVESSLTQLEAAAGHVRFLKLDVDENPRTASRYGVLSLPTVMLFADGEPHETVVGARSRRHFEKKLAPWLDTR